MTDSVARLLALSAISEPLYTAGENIVIDDNNVISAIVRTYKPLKDSWKQSTTTGGLTVAEFCAAINADTTVAEGDAYCGPIVSNNFFQDMYLEDSSDPLTSAEVKVQIMGTWGTGHVMLLTVTSSNHAPYFWQRTWSDGADPWVSWSDIRKLNSSTTSNELHYLSLNGTEYKIPVYNDTELRTLVNGKQNTLVSGTNIKTINGETLLGNGNLAIKTYQAFPNGELSGSLADVVQAIMNFPGKAQGMGYLGSIRGECTPFGYGNAECSVTFVTNGIALLSVSSSNISPYHWEYNTAQNDYIWRKYSNVVANPTGSTSNLLNLVSIDGVLYNVGVDKATSIKLGKSITAQSAIGGISAGKTYAATDTLAQIIEDLLS